MRLCVVADHQSPGRCFLWGMMRQLLAEGWEISAADVAQLSPYLTGHISRFGVYATDVLRLRPDDFDPDQ